MIFHCIKEIILYVYIKKIENKQTWKLIEKEDKKKHQTKYNYYIPQT